MAERGRVARIVAPITAFVLGLIASFFTAGVALFADGSFEQRPPVLAFSVLLFVSLGMVLGALAPEAWKPVAVALALAALPVVLYLGADIVGQLPMTALAVGFALGDAAAGAFGAWAGARLRARSSV